MKKPLIIILLVIIVDQIIKFWIKTTMTLGEEIHVFDNWFIIHFTENEGMAFGLKFGGDFGKLLLSVFRIIAIVLIAIYLKRLINKKENQGLIISISLILAGAIGNIIDSAFYGMIFTDSYARVAGFMTAEGGYAGFLHGKVVDMFYFPLFQLTFPEWLPLFGGHNFLFFRPVFNISDASITVGVLYLLLFQRRFFKQEKEEKILVENEEDTGAEKKAPGS